MKKILLIIITLTSFAIIAKEKSNCKYGNNPVCGQPPLAECEQGETCIQMMPAHKNYSNRCAMEKEKAYLVSEGACFDPMIEPLKK